MSTVLIVEDDIDLREEMAHYLTSSGYTVTVVGSVAQAEQALAGAFDLLLLDINLPDGCGMELCRRMRPYIKSGIVMCTGRSERELRIMGLKDGADAYLVKPVDPEEIEANFTSLERRLKRHHASILPTAAVPIQWRVDRTHQTLTGPNGNVINLSRSESLLLGCISLEPDRLASRSKLLEAFEVAGTSFDGRRMEALASRLRSKVIEKMGLNLPLQPVYGKGYTFTDHIELI